jgi:hypothetical protein
MRSIQALSWLGTAKLYIGAPMTMSPGQKFGECADSVSQVIVLINLYAKATASIGIHDPMVRGAPMRYPAL